MATYTPEQWIIKMDSRLKELESDKPMILAIQSTVADYVNRVFIQGLNSRGVAIGKYSNKPLYINPKNSPKGFNTIGKTGRSVFKNGRKHRTRYFESGYGQFKNVIGRGSKVNLVLFGELRNDAASVKLRKTSQGFDYILKKQINAKKVDGLTKHFGGIPIFNLTKSERAKFTDILRKETLQILNS